MWGGSWIEEKYNAIYITKKIYTYIYVHIYIQKPYETSNLQAVLYKDFISMWCSSWDKKRPLYVEQLSKLEPNSISSYDNWSILFT